jgi:hypothetical protein
VQLELAKAAAIHPRVYVQCVSYRNTYPPAGRPAGASKRSVLYVYFPLPALVLHCDDCDLSVSYVSRLAQAQRIYFLFLRV